MNRDDVNPITEGVIWKQLLRYFAPLLAASFLQLLYNTADTIIVGRYVGKIALTAVGGSAGQIYAMVTEFLIVGMMRYLLPFYILYIPNGVYFSTLRGMGDSLRPTLITFFGVCVLRIFWVAFVFPRFPSIRALLLCFPISWCVTALIYTVYYRIFMKKYSAMGKSM